MLGYRPADVEYLLAEAYAEAGRSAESERAQRARAEELVAELARVRLERSDRDRKIAHLEAELELFRAWESSRLRGLAALGAELDELRVTARGQATRIRLDALRQAAGVAAAAKAAELEGAGKAGAALASLWRTLERAVDRLGSEWVEPAREEDEEEAEEGPTARPVVATNGRPASAERANGSGPAPTGADRRVSVDVGPFRDFSQLVSFEDAASSIEGTERISIRRFSDGRANLDVGLSGPVDLLRELEERCDLEFVVRSNRGDEIVLDLGS